MVLWSYDDSNGMRIQSLDTIALKTANTERMRIDSTGNLLVGKTTATATDLGCQIENDGQIKTTTDQQSGLTLNRKTNDGAIAIFQKDGSGVGSISVTSSATAYNTSSDERLKDTIPDSADARRTIAAIPTRQFNWKANSTHTD